MYPSLSFLTAEEYSTVWIFHSLFNHSPTEKLCIALGITNKALGITNGYYK